MRDWNRVRGLAPRMQTAAQTVCTQSKEPPFPLLRLSGLRPLGLSGGYLSLCSKGPLAEASPRALSGRSPGSLRAISGLGPE